MRRNTPGGSVCERFHDLSLRALVDLRISLRTHWGLDAGPDAHVRPSLAAHVREVAESPAGATPEVNAAPSTTRRRIVRRWIGCSLLYKPEGTG